MNILTTLKGLMKKANRLALDVVNHVRSESKDDFVSLNSLNSLPGSLRKGKFESYVYLWSYVNTFLGAEILAK